MQVHLPLYPRTAIYATATGNTNYAFSGTMHPTGLTPDEGAVLVRITVLVGTGSTLTVGMTDGNTEVTGLLNSGTALTAGQWYTFEFGARSAYKYDFKLGTAATLTLFVEEVGGGAS